MKPIITIFAVFLALGLWWSAEGYAQNKTEKTTPAKSSAAPKTTAKQVNSTPAKPAVSPTSSKSKTATDPKKNAETQKAKAVANSKQASPVTAAGKSVKPTAAAATPKATTIATATTAAALATKADTAAARQPAIAAAPLLPLKGFGANMVQAGSSSILQITATMANSGQADTVINGNYPFSFNGVSHFLLFTRGTSTYVFPKDSVPARIFIAHTSSEGKKIEQMLQIKQGDNGGQIPKNLPRWVALLPVLLAVVLSLLLREPIFSLFTALFVSIWALNGFALSKILPSLINIFDRYLAVTLSNPNHISLLTAVLLAGGMGALITHNGGISGLATGFSSMVSSARGAQMTAWVAGVLVFFDQLAGIIVGGQVARPLTDRLRVSREKLAFLLNATTSSVAVLAIFGTLVGLAILPVGNVLKNAGNAASPVSVWLFSLQYAFYPVWMLLFSLCSALFLRDYGPMLRAERRARYEGRLFDSRIAQEAAKAEYATTALPIGNKTARGYNAVLPLLAFIVAAFVGVFYESFDKTLLYGNPSEVGTSILDTAQQANQYRGLLWGSVAGILTAIILTIVGRWLSLRGAVESMLSGMKNVFPYIAVLLLTLTLVQVCGELHTADYLATWFPTSPVAFLWLPLLAFALTALLVWALGSISAAIIFALPIMLALAWQMGNSVGIESMLGMALFYGSLASILAGALFGSHSSIIAQNTVISSLSADCPTTDHVQTQLPYSILMAFLHLSATALCIFFPVPAWIIMVGGIALLPLLLFAIGRQPKPLPTATVEQQTATTHSQASDNSAATAVLTGATALGGLSEDNDSKPPLPPISSQEENNTGGADDNNSTAVINTNAPMDNSEIKDETFIYGNSINIDDNGNDSRLNEGAANSEEEQEAAPYWKKEATEEDENIDHSVLSFPASDATDNIQDTPVYDTEPLPEKYKDVDNISSVIATDNNAGEDNNNDDTADINHYHAVFEDEHGKLTKDEEDTESYGFQTLNDRLKQWRDGDKQNENDEHKTIE